MIGLLRRDPRVVYRRGRAARRALRRRARAHRDRAARRRPRLLLARRPARRPHGARATGSTDAGAAVRRPHPAAQGCRRRHRRAGRAAQPRRAARGRRRAERARGRGRAGEAHRLLADELGVDDRVRWVEPAAPPPARRPTTAPPTCAWCRAGRSRSGWSRSRRPPAACRWWPPPSAGCARSSTTASTGVPRRRSRPDVFAAPSTQLLADPATARAMGEAAATRARGYTWSTTAARLRRLYADLTARAPVDCTA